jgi:predicted membrane protein
LKTLLGLGSLTIIIGLGLFVAWVVGVLVLGKPIAVNIFGRCQEDKSPFSPCLASYGTLGFLIILLAVLFACLILSPSIIAVIVLLLLLHEMWKERQEEQTKKRIKKEVKEVPDEVNP